MNLIATKRVRYRRKVYEPGEPFEAGTTDGRVLIGIGCARLGPVMAPEFDEDDAPKPKKKRAYKRRDLTSE